MNPEPRPKLGNYELEDKLGTGATADVYRAMQPGVERSVAIKVMHPHVAGNPDFSARFQREARAMGQLQHPHISRVIDFEADADHPFMVMEHLAGGSLRDLIQGRAEDLEIDYAVMIVRQLADALDYAHTMGMVHRDLKPGNVMFTDDQVRHAVLTDFGMARLANEAMTVSGTMLGTPAYMAPEQVRGEGAEAAADQYSLGVMLYELVTGELPFTADSLHGLMMKHTTDEPASPRSLNPEVSPELESIILTMMQKEPAQRYASAGELRSALDALSRGDGDSMQAPTVMASRSPSPSRRAATGTGERSKARLGFAVVGVVAVAALTVFGLSRVGNDDPTIDAAAVPTQEQLVEPAQDTPAPAATSAVVSETPAAAPEPAAEPTLAPVVSAEPAFDVDDPPPLFPSTASIAGDQFFVAFENSRRPSAGMTYVAWLGSTGLTGPIGEILVGDDGTASLSATVPALFGARSFIVTEEVAGSSPDSPSAAVVFSRPLSDAAIERLEGSNGILQRIQEQFAIAVEHDSFIEDEIQAGNDDEARRHGEHVVNILDGADGSNFGDLDGDGVAQNPGDGVGVRVYADQLASALAGDEFLGVGDRVVVAQSVFSDLAQGAQRPFTDYLDSSALAELEAELDQLMVALERELADVLVFGEAAVTRAQRVGQQSVLAGGQTIRTAGAAVPGDVIDEPATRELLTAAFGEEAAERLDSQQAAANALVVELQLAIDHAELMQNEIAADNHSEVRRHAEHVVNILVGESSPSFGDLDGDGAAQNPGNGVGALVYLDELMQSASALPGDTTAQIMSQLVWNNALAQIQTLVDTASAEALRVIATDTAAEAAPMVDTIFASLVPARDGSDLDDNGVIDVFAGEAGAALLSFQAPTLLTGPLTPDG